MSKTLRTLTAAALAATLAWPVSSQDTPTADTVVATVNGVDITLGHMLMVRAGLPEQYQQLPVDVLWDGVMEQLIQQTALSQGEGATETRRVTLALDNERRALLAAEAITAVAEGAVTDEALQAAYDAQYANAAAGMEYNASHILVETEEAAAAIVTELEGGADFAEVAREKSTGPSGPSGGSLGWFGPGMMVAPFEDAVEALEPGTISAPVQTQFGWHVIRLNETRTTTAPALEEVRDALASELQQKAVEDHIDALVGAAEVTRTTKQQIDTSILNNLDLLEN
ncbi:peptidylprolyl isomerase [Aestuariicoccus sp. MJ-SS9]|uniref:peptidylprolyl isomerase n=1 Tax=Aestuariicoccus sp. MJ-SS9 TaxID=3079855 RepID=UPI002912223E|nr:peptidylprolyl isomerase [Aestuariicoccus sp. MJ-SS9]MDU8910204.1 peptidylprolyl isomerase [Aestuariicoccus sp. MJ-SS9]